MKLFDNYEISPCARFEEPDSPGRFYFEVCPPEQADVWTLYGHIDGEGVQAIGDFSKREHAEEAFERITGIPFTGSYQAATRLRIMHAGPKLLEAVQYMVAWAERHGLNKAELITGGYAEVPVIGIARAAIAEATGRAA